MVLARKESTYIQEQIEKQEQPQIRKNKKRQKSYKLEKFIVTIVIAAVFACSILILTRFMAITEARHQVNSLENQLERLEIEREKLRVEVEKVSKSGWVESEAKSRLHMEYPTAEQMIYININPTKVAMLTSEINKEKYKNSITQDDNKSLYTFFEKLVSYIRI